MTVKYFPKLNPDQSQVPGQEVAFAVLIPDGYTPAKKWIPEIATHGMGELSSGTLENLKNLVEGFDYNGDGIREGAPFVTPDMKKAVDQYGIVMFIPTYSNFFEPNMVNFVYDYALANYNLYPKMIYTGFSLGGGSGIKYGTSSEANASRVGLLVLCAPTVNIVDKTIPGRVGLPVHCFHNDRDDRVSSSNSKTIVTKLNESNPAIRAQYTLFRKDGHGGNIEAWALAPPVAPGGQGVLDASENIYQWGIACITGTARQIKTGAATTTPPPIETPPPTAQAIVSHTIEGNNIHLIGDKSTGYTSGSQGRWELVSAPGGLKSWNVFPNGSTYINADGVMNLPGTYVFRFILMTLSPVEVVVNHGTVTKTATGFSSVSDLITYSDGTTERGEAVYANGVWTVRNSAGQIINLVIKK